MDGVDLIVRGGMVVVPGGIVRASLAVRDGVIVGVSDDDALPRAREIIDASGRHVIPGIVDPHVHFRSPGFEYKEDERGRDPREYVLFAFGGNGPLFAAGMACQLEMTRIVVPPAPGLFSSFGLLYGDVEHHYVRTYRRPTRALDFAELNGIVEKMEADALGQLAGEGFRGAAARLKRSADLCYQGQSFELTVPLAAGTLDARAIAELEDLFGREHERVYGHRAGPDEPVQLVSLRVVAHGIPDRPRVPDRVAVDRHPAHAARRDPDPAPRVFRRRARLARDADSAPGRSREVRGRSRHRRGVRCHQRDPADGVGPPRRLRQYRHRAEVIA